MERKRKEGARYNRLFFPFRDYDKPQTLLQKNHDRQIKARKFKLLYKSYLCNQI